MVVEPQGAPVRRGPHLLATALVVAAVLLLVPLAGVVAPPASAQFSGALCIGDSVMLGAGPQYSNTLSMCAVVDATVSRQFSAGASAAAVYGPPFPATVVVGLGNNGTATSAQVDQLMAVLASVPRVVLVTNQLNGTRSWEAGNNEVIRAAAARYPGRVAVADWKAASEGHPEYFAADRIHLRPVGAQAYAATIAAAGTPPPPPPVEPPGPSVTAIGGEQLALARRVPGGAVQVREYTGTGWTGWEGIGGGTRDEPDVTSRTDGGLDVFVRGLDGAVWHRSTDGTTWSAWRTLGGGFRSGPAAVARDATHLDVFARGLDDAVWTASFDGTRWSAWRSLGGGIVGAPDVASWGPDRWDLVARGRDDQVWHRGASGSSVSPWIALGGRLTSSPAATSWGPGRIDVFGRGGDGAVWTRARDAAGWGPWQTLGGNVRSAPDATSRPGERWDVVAEAPDGNVWMRSRSGGTIGAWRPVPATATVPAGAQPRRAANTPS
jgi:hypothetical protein